MRVTENMRYQSVVANLSRLSADQVAASQVASSGRRVNAPSDDPAAAAELVRISAASSQSTVYRAAISSARNDLQAGEAALSQTSSLFARALEIATQGGNASLSSGERSSLAEEAGQLFEQAIALANAQGANGYVFSGTATGQPAFSQDGTFQGNDLDHAVELGPGQRSSVNPSGSRAFTAAGGRDVLADLKTLQTALANDDPTAVRATLDNLKQSQAQVVAEQAHCGLMLNRLDTSDSVLDELDADLSRRNAAAGDADPYESYSRLNELGAALDRSVSVARQLLSVGQDNRF